MKANECTVLHLCCTNDNSGNPRRLYAVYHGGHTVAVLDEGYRGLGILSDTYGKEIGSALANQVAMVVNITPKQYNQLRDYGLRYEYKVTL